MIMMYLTNKCYLLMEEFGQKRSYWYCNGPNRTIILWVFLCVKSSEIAKGIFNLSDQANTKFPTSFSYRVYGTDAFCLFGQQDKICHDFSNTIYSVVKTCGCGLWCGQNQNAFGPKKRGRELKKESIAYYQSLSIWCWWEMRLIVFYTVLYLYFCWVQSPRIKN